MTDSLGRLMIDVDGFNLSHEDKSLLSSKHIGGLILFSKNLQIMELEFKFIAKLYY